MKNKLKKINRYVNGIVLGLFTILGIEYFLLYTIGLNFDKSQEILFYALISFFSLVIAVLSLNIDLSMRTKWKMMLIFTFWSGISFLTGYFASISAIQIVDQDIYPIISVLAWIWRSYLLLFITCVNFISAIFLFHKIASAIQIDTIEWFKRDFGPEGNPPKANLSPIAKKVLSGLIIQLFLNAMIFAYGSPEAFFEKMSIYVQQLLVLLGI